jgi:pyrroline-5-carboxylate reductase
MTQGPKSLHLDGPLLLVGAGKMGSAMLSGWLAAGLDPKAVLVQEPHAAPEAMALCRAHGVSLAAHHNPGAAPAVIVMAVKPQVMGEVFPAVAALAGPGTITLSIAAGKTIASFAAHLPPGSAIVRAMPNTPAAIGRGMTVLCANALTTPAQRTLCANLLAAVGETGWIEDEALMDAVTAVSGSGPAYVFLLAEAMTQAGISAGLDADLASRLARSTISGSGALLDQSELDAATLRHNVTSPGGTTAAALSVLMADDGLPRLLSRAVDAAVARSKTLS